MDDEEISPWGSERWYFHKILSELSDWFRADHVQSRWICVKSGTWGWRPVPAPGGDSRSEVIALGMLSSSTWTFPACSSSAACCVIYCSPQIQNQQQPLWWILHWIKLDPLWIYGERRAGMTQVIRRPSQLAAVIDDIEFSLWKRTHWWNASPQT